jgi:hypothetical protein
MESLLKLGWFAWRFSRATFLMDEKLVWYGFLICVRLGCQLEQHCSLVTQHPETL